MDSRFFLAAAGILGFLGVGLGAFGAHKLKEMVPPEQLAIWDTASRYHLIHACALALAALAMERLPPSRLLSASAWSFTGGMLVFSGTLYILVLSGKKWLGAITPIGGVALMAAWLLLALAAWNGRNP
ncbi:MAG: hypothetical protein GMKNLPBB_01161 [Myxococcota bacterium]|nr:hypothetical protein [Myxococcota bacterium]